ncbi:hypothetical protein [Mycobacterium sp. 236(2023)]|uniref:hypothetical protein n=1 Tax=Mycobacterium sp. 236(2023) TaxID=3038163 RepID=UPI002414EB18|nr:hypothetical protein [Mycobacterium sp. 236(2023)]MDG4666666.1 hypothetical protein [Mycobacterium sp. 236(2023)]
MARTRRMMTAFFIAAGAAVMALAPSAQAAPPEGLAGTPVGEVYTLAEQGYDVQINWDEGKPANVPLALCTVTGVNTSAKPVASVSVSCPPSVP